MVKKSMLVAAVAVLTIADAAVAQQEKAPVSPSPIKRNIVAKLEQPNSNYDVITGIVEIAPRFIVTYLERGQPLVQPVK